MKLKELYNVEMNRQVQRMHQRRCALKNSLHGGGLSVDMMHPIQSSYGVPIEIRGAYNECYNELRPGEIRAEANPDLAQVAMAGGKRRHRTRRVCGGCGCMWGKRGRTQRAGGYGLFPNFNVGGQGPIAEPARLTIPCDARAGSANPFAAPMESDPRAPMQFYSVTPNTLGGSTNMVGGGYEGQDCYKAPGSQMPVYPAESVGFNFRPSTEAGAALPDGVTGYNEVMRYAARLGGGRKTYRKKAAKKARKAKTRGRK